VEFIINALAPAKIVKVLMMMDDPRQTRALVIVPDDQLSLAIGREGQNVRLAAKLTGFKLDIKSISQVEREGGLAYFEQMASSAPVAAGAPEQAYIEEGFAAEYAEEGAVATEAPPAEEASYQEEAAPELQESAEEAEE
jgi:transcription termination/antitermination protein NusA